MTSTLVTISLVILTAGIGAPVDDPRWSAAGNRLDAHSAAALLPPPAPLPFVSGDIAGTLGANRMRSLREARFYLRRATGDPAWSLDQQPHIHDRVQDILRSNFLKLVREYAEDRLSVDARLDRLRGRAARRPGGPESDSEGLRLRLSPGFHGGSDPGLGLKLGLRGENRPLLSHTSFEVRRYLDSDATMMRLKYARGDRIFSFEHRRDDRRLGDAYLFWVQTSF